jgi:Peptidase family M23
MARELIFDRMPAAGPITGSFGEEYRRNGKTYLHRGLDIGCPAGTPVYAPAGGPVVPFLNDGTFGIAVCIDHLDTPWYSLYAHLNGDRVNVGDVVAAGQLIGVSGATGDVDGAHLHWQVCKSAVFPIDIAQSADPLSFLRTGPGPVPTVPLTVEERLAAIEARQDELEAELMEQRQVAELTNAALVRRFELIEVALGASNGPEFERMNRAHAVLKREGLIS